MKSPSFKQIRDLRNEIGVTQVELAKACGFTSSYVSLVERGGAKLCGKTCDVITEALNRMKNERLDKAITEFLMSHSLVFAFSSEDVRKETVERYKKIYSYSASRLCLNEKYYPFGDSKEKSNDDV